MPARDTLSILTRIALAYPDKHLDIDTIELYQVELSDIPLPLLDQVVRQHIRSSPWLPHISDLRQAAQQLAGSANFASLPSPGQDFLTLEAFQLEDEYFHKGEFDLPAWEALADQLERVGRPHCAEELRGKARHIQEREAACQKGEEYPPRPVRLRYAQWDTKA
jgi:hypothetical protein